MRWRVAVVVVVQFVGGCVRLIDKNRIAIVSTGSTARLQNQRGTGREGRTHVPLFVQTLSRTSVRRARLDSIAAPRRVRAVLRCNLV